MGDRHMVKPHWMGEREVARERAQEDVAYRREQDEMFEARCDERDHGMFDDGPGREW